MPLVLSDEDLFWLAHVQRLEVEKAGVFALICRAPGMFNTAIRIIEVVFALCDVGETLCGLRKQLYMIGLIIARLTVRIRLTPLESVRFVTLELDFDL